MKDIFKIIDTLSAVRFKSVDIDAMTTLKGGTYWVNVVIRLLPSIGLSVTGPRVRAIVIIFRKVSFLASTQGIKGLVIHLKACAVMLAQSQGGHNIKDSGKMGSRISRNNKGMPRFILSADRIRIRKGDTGMFRFYQTIFNLYRVLSFFKQPNLETITAPFSGDKEFIYKTLIPLIPSFVKALLSQNNPFPTREGGFTWVGWTKVVTPGKPAVMEWLINRYSELSPLWLAKSAAGTRHEEGIQVSSHPYLMIRTVRTIVGSDIGPNFRYFISLLPINAPFSLAFEACETVSYLFKPLFTLGKIGFKEEAAGKVRLFAMAPTWFQIMLEPVHEALFLILRGIKQDGTFDQLAPLKNHHLKYSEAFSLDLTAATDRLPLNIQTEIVKELTGSAEFAHNWAKLLTGIEYSANSMKFGISTVVKYSVGQPMGALSSWASLAVTHHFLVQASAWLSGHTPQGRWFKDYAILGDDVVIFNREVSIEYRKVIRLIGMNIGLHKSILSQDGSVIEFAKRIFYKGIDVSPIPFKEYFAALFGYGNILDFGRKYNLTFVGFARTLGFKYQALSKIGKGFKCLPSGLKRLFVASSLPGVSSEVEPFLQLGAPIKAKWPISLDLFWQQFSISELRSLLKTMSDRHQAVLNDASMFPNLGNYRLDPLLLDCVSSRFAMLLGPWDSGNWQPAWRTVENTNVDLNDYDSEFAGKGWIPGPAELKEDWCGFVMQNDSKLMQPIKISSNLQFRDYHALHTNKYIELSDVDNYWVGQALAALFDAHILPKRIKLLENLQEVQRLIVNNWVLPEDMSEVFLTFLQLSREAASIPSKTVAFERVNSVARSTDPISLRLWRRWGKLIQGTVSRKDINNQIRLPNTAELDPYKGLSLAYENVMKVINSRPLP
nr:MAG: putative RNA-dependent RNA polymerase [Mitoviridae sp.]